MCDSRLSADDAHEQASRLSALDLYEDLLVKEDSQDGNRVLTMQEVVLEKKTLQEQNTLLLQQLMETKLQVQKFAEEKANLQKNMDSLLATARVELKRKNDLLSRYITGSSGTSFAAARCSVPRIQRNSSSQPASKKKGLLELYKGKRVKDEELKSSSVKASASLSPALLQHRGEKMVGVATRVIGSSFENLGDSTTTLAAIKISSNSPAAGSQASHAVASTADAMSQHDLRRSEGTVYNASFPLRTALSNASSVNTHARAQTSRNNISKCDNFAGKKVIENSLLTSANRYGVSESSKGMSGESSTENILQHGHGTTDDQFENSRFPKRLSMIPTMPVDDCTTGQNSRLVTSRRSSLSDKTETRLDNLNDICPTDGRPEDRIVIDRDETLRRHSHDTPSSMLRDSSDPVAVGTKSAAVQLQRMTDVYSMSLYESRRGTEATSDGSTSARPRKDDISKPKRSEHLFAKCNAEVLLPKSDSGELYSSKPHLQNDGKREKNTDVRSENDGRKKSRSISRTKSENGHREESHSKSRPKREKLGESSRPKSEKKKSQKSQSKDSAGIPKGSVSKLYPKHGVDEREKSHFKSRSYHIMEHEEKLISSSYPVSDKKHGFSSHSEEASCSNVGENDKFPKCKRKSSKERTEMEDSARQSCPKKTKSRISKKRDRKIHDVQKSPSKSDAQHIHGISMNKSDRDVRIDQKVESSLSFSTEVHWNSVRYHVDSKNSGSSDVRKKLKSKKAAESDPSKRMKEKEQNVTNKRKTFLPRKSDKLTDENKTVSNSFDLYDSSKKHSDLSEGKVSKSETNLISVGKQHLINTASRKLSLSDASDVHNLKRISGESSLSEVKYNAPDQTDVDCLDLEFDYDENSLMYRDLMHPDDAELLAKTEEADSDHSTDLKSDDKLKNAPAHAFTSHETLKLKHLINDHNHDHVNLCSETTGENSKSRLVEKPKATIKTFEPCNFAEGSEQHGKNEQNSSRPAKENSTHQTLPKYELKVCLVDIRKSVPDTSPVKKERKRKASCESEKSPRKKRPALQKQHSLAKRKQAKPSPQDTTVNNEDKKMVVEVDSSNARISEPPLDMGGTSEKSCTSQNFADQPSTSPPGNRREKCMSGKTISVKLGKVLTQLADGNPVTVPSLETGAEFQDSAMDTISGRKTLKLDEIVTEPSKSDCDVTGATSKKNHNQNTSPIEKRVTTALSHTAGATAPQSAKYHSPDAGMPSRMEKNDFGISSDEAPEDTFIFRNEKQMRGGSLLDCEPGFVLPDAVTMMDVAMEVVVEPGSQEASIEEGEKQDVDAEIFPESEKRSVKTSVKGTVSQIEDSKTVAVSQQSVLKSTPRKKKKKGRALEKEKRVKTACKKKVKPKKTLKIKMKAFKKDRKKNQETVSGISFSDQPAISITDVVASLPDVEDSVNIPEASPLLNQWLASARSSRWRKREREESRPSGKKERREIKRLKKCLKTAGENVETDCTIVREVSAGSTVKAGIQVKLEERSPIPCRSQLADSAYSLNGPKRSFQALPCKQEDFERDLHWKSSASAEKTSNGRKTLDCFTPALFPTVDNKGSVLRSYRNAALQWLMHLAMVKLRSSTGNSEGSREMHFNPSVEQMTGRNRKVCINQGKPSSPTAKLFLEEQPASKCHGKSGKVNTTTDRTRHCGKSENDFDNLLKQHAKNQKYSKKLEIEKLECSVSISTGQKSPAKKRKPRRVLLERVEMPPPQSDSDLISPLSRTLWMSSLDKCRERRKQMSRWSSEIAGDEERLSSTDAESTAAAPSELPPGTEHISRIKPLQAAAKPVFSQSIVNYESSDPSRNRSNHSLSDLIPDASLSSSWQLSEESRHRFFSFAKAVKALSPLKTPAREASVGEEYALRKVL